MKTSEALQLLIILTEQTAKLAAAYNKAHSEGRDTLTDEEVATFRKDDDAARDSLQQKIDAVG